MFSRNGYNRFLTMHFYKNRVIGIVFIYEKSSPQDSALSSPVFLHLYSLQKVPTPSPWPGEKERTEITPTPWRQHKRNGGMTAARGLIPYFLQKEGERERERERAALTAHGFKDHIFIFV